jgi:hypothetical protein
MLSSTKILCLLSGAIAGVSRNLRDPQMTAETELPVFEEAQPGF